MSGEFMTCRAISADGLVNYDFAALRGGHIIEDLGERDFTVNAMAVELPGREKGHRPFGGGAHLAYRELVPVNDSIFDNDPLRLLRAPGWKKTHKLVIGPSLARLISARATLASSPAAERIFLNSRILAAPGVSASVARLDELGLLEVLLPELSALKGVAQNEYHHSGCLQSCAGFPLRRSKTNSTIQNLSPGSGQAISKRITGESLATLIAVWSSSSPPFSMTSPNLTAASSTKAGGCAFSSTTVSALIWPMIP